MGFIYLYLWILLLGLISFFVVTEKEVVIFGKTVKRKLWPFAIIAMIPLILVVTYRSNWIGDTMAYKGAFNAMPTSYPGLVSLLEKVGQDYGYYIFVFIIKKFITTDPIMYFCIIASLQSLAVVIFFRNYSEDFIMSLYMFVTLGTFISWMMNGIRQFSAVCFIMFAIPCFLKKKYFLSIVFLLLAIAFHGTAIIMPFLFLVCMGKPFNKLTITYIVVFVVVLLFLDSFTNILDSAGGMERYSGQISYAISHGDDGMNPLRFLVGAVPTILSIPLVLNHYELVEDDPLIRYSINASLVGSLISLLAVFTSGNVIGRLAIYSSITNQVLLPFEIKYLFKGKMQPLVYFVTMLLYLGFYYYSIRNIMWL